MSTFTYLLLFPLLICLVSSCKDCYDRVRLKDVSTLTFHHGKRTKSRHGNRIPELECVGGDALKYSKYHPLSVQCFNRGFDGRDVNWECHAQLDKQVRFGALTVNCEGYDYPGDDYVTHGSCGLQYELVFTGHKRSHGFHLKRWIDYAWLPSLFSPILPVLSLVLVGVLIWYFCLRGSIDYPEQIGFRGAPTPVEPSAPYPTESPPDYEEATRTRRPDSADYSTRFRSPPPNYGWRSYPFSSSSSSGWFSSAPRYRPKVAPESTSWWSHGLAAGAGLLGGYWFGSRDRDIRETVTPTVTTTTNSHRHRLYPDLDENDSLLSRRESSDHTESEVYTATGYAKTSRR